MVLGTLGASFLGNMLAGKWVIRAGYRVHRAISRMNLNSKVCIHEIINQTLWRIGLK